MFIYQINIIRSIIRYILIVYLFYLELYKLDQTLEKFG
jgi:hypothetical protein